jgi:hypothetical protein
MRFPGKDRPSVAEIQVETSIAIHIEDSDASSHDFRKMMLASGAVLEPKVNSRPGRNLAENDGRARLGRGLTGASTVRFASREGNKKTSPRDRVQSRPSHTRNLDARRSSRVWSLATAHHHFPIMPLEFRSRKGENP